VYMFLNDVRIQKAGPNDGLSNTQEADNQKQNGVKNKKAAKVSFGVHHRITQKHQGDIEKIKLKAQKAVEHTGRGGVKDLRDSEPEQNQKRDEKGRLENDFFFPVEAGTKERDIDQQHQNILGKIK